MIVLAIDTAGTGCFAGLYDSATETLLGSAGAEIGRGHAEQLMDFIDDALSMSGKAVTEIDRIAVTVGPGSFTGIRVGVSAARGFALALGMPAVGVSTLAALAAAARRVQPGKAITVVLDAKRDEVYAQAFDADGRAASAPQLLDVENARTMFSDKDTVFTGSGAVHLDPSMTAAGPDLIDIALVASLGAKVDPFENLPRPLYLRGPDVKPQAGFAVART